MKINTEPFKKRRLLFQDKMKDDSIAFFISPAPSIRSNDVHYPYKTDSNLYYLTGFSEEETVLVITKTRTFLYLRPRNPEMETWNGKRLGIERACETLHIDEAKDISSFSNDLTLLLKNKHTVYHYYGSAGKYDPLILETCSNLIHRARAGEYGPENIIHPSVILDEMRLIKDEFEINIMKDCASITEEAHRSCMRNVKPGMYEYELEALLLQSFHRHGGTYAYPSIVASGDNACILHYTENNKKIEKNDLILIDAGSEKYYLTSDVTRTFPAGGRFTEAQKSLYSLVLSVQKKAISEMTEGNSLENIHEKTVERITEGLIELKILKGSLKENLAKKNYRSFYMHKTSHWLGMDVHDVGRYHLEGKPRPLQNGMVATIEPGIYIDPSDDTVPAEFRGIGIRIEDDILVNGKTPINLTAAIPREIDEIESLILSGQ